MYVICRHGFLINFVYSVQEVIEGLSDKAISNSPNSNEYLNSPISQSMCIKCTACLAGLHSVMYIPCFSYTEMSRTQSTADEVISSH